MNKFGWDYPPGCSGVPDDDVPDPHQYSDRAFDLLERAGVDHEIIDQICIMIEELASERECPVCLERQARESESNP